MAMMTKNNSKLINSVDDILFSKFDIPIISRGSIPRKRLVDLISNSINSRVVLVVAPTGYGKTTLLSEWVESSRSHDDFFVWLTLDETDNNPTKFWLSIGTGIQRIYENFQLNPNLLLYTEKDNSNYYQLTSLLNGISKIPKTLFLILDDYQWISDERINHGLAYLIDHQPNNFKIIISSRTTPPFSLSRLKAKGQVVEITSNDLAFSKIELHSFLKTKLNIGIDDDLVNKLYQYTEGWVAGLQLIEFSLQGSSNIYSLINENLIGQSQISEYLSEEVIKQQDGDTQEFLIKTSILNELSASFCDSVLCRTDSISFLKKIETKNLFIEPLGNDHTWFHYHRFFAEILQGYLKKQYPDQINCLHKNAANWLFEKGYPEKAVSHAIAANDLELASSILDSCTTFAINSFNVNQLIQWMSLFSEELIVRRPTLALYSAFVYMHAYQFDQTRKYLDLLNKIIENKKNQMTKNELYTLRWNIDSYKASMDCLGLNISAGIKSANDLRKRAPKDQSYFWGQMTAYLAFGYIENGNYESAWECFRESRDRAFTEDVHLEYFIVESGMAYILLKQGKLNEAGDLYRELLEYCKKKYMGSENIAFIQVSLAEIAIEQYDLNQIDQWEKVIEQEIQALSINSLPWIIQDLFDIRISRYYLFRNNMEKALFYFQKVKTNYKNFQQGKILVLSELLLLQARLWMRTGQIASDISWVKSQINHLLITEQQKPEEMLILAKTYSMQGELDTAIGLLESMESRFKTTGADGLLQLVLIQYALIYYQKKDKEKSYRYLREVIQKAQPENNKYCFVINGTPMKELLEEYFGFLQGTAKNQLDYLYLSFIKELLTNFDADIFFKENADKEISIEYGQKSILAQGISKRELEVLILLVKAKSPKEISIALSISINTTKVHIKNIYRKLDAHSRLSLYQKAIDFGII
jgi:LuxR family transcriptional regulator, maltose regulon positive regulatory protein